MGHALGRRVVYRDVPEKMLLKALRAQAPANFSEAAASQLACYAEEYRRGTFAINAPTDHVMRVSGHAPEAFADIVARYVAARPDLRQSLPGRLRAVVGFAKMLMTPVVRPQQTAPQRDYVQLSAPRCSQNSAAWRSTDERHAAPQTG